MNRESSAASDDGRSKAIDLFRYLRAVTELRLRQTLDIDHWDQVIWFADLAAAPNCLTRLDQDDLDDWVRIERPPAPPGPPTLPPQLRGLVPPEEIDDWRGTPSLAQEQVAAVRPLERGAQRASDRGGYPTDDPNVRDAWATYQDRWLDWAAEREAAEPSHETYRQFFLAYNKAIQLGEQYEVVVAVGLLSWRQPETSIRRHLVTTPASITLDPGSGLISVAPSDIGNQRIGLEDEMVPAGSRPSSDATRGVRAALDAADGPFEESVNSALRQWIQTADDAGVFSTALQPAGRATARPEVRLAPAVILRRRQERSLRQTYDAIIHQIEAGDRVPPAVGSLVENAAESFHREAVDGESTALRFEPSEKPLFPLPANPQQHRILEELAVRRGVVVQGPPGTGKSHTIANLISHCLATGRRVLVTSHTERALRVLKGQLPEEIRDLTVSVLGAGREGAADLQRSANALLGRRSDPSRSIENLRTQIDRLSETLTELQESRERCTREAAALRAAASRSHQLPSGYNGPTGDIAGVLADERDSYGWFPDSVSGPMPLSHEELIELQVLRDQVQLFDANLRSHHFPASEILPTAEQVRSVQQVTADAERLLRGSDGNRETAERLRRSPIDLAHLAELVRTHDDADRAARRRSEPWLDDALRDWDAGRTNRWEDLRRRTTAYLERRFEHPHESAVTSAIRAGDLPTLADQTNQLVEHLEEGGRFSGVLRRQARVVKRNRLAFDCADRLAVPLRDLESARWLRSLVDELREFDELSRHWDQHAGRLDGTVARARATFQDYRDTLDHLAAISDARDRLSEIAGGTLADPVDTAEDVSHLRDALRVAEALTTQDAANSRRRELLDTLRAAGHARSHPKFRQLFEAVEGLQVEQYRTQRDDLLELIEQRQELDRFDALRDSLSAVAPQFAEALTATGPIEIPEAESLERAWRWSWAMTDVQRLRDTSESALTTELNRVDSEIAGHTAALTERRAWYNTLSGLTDDEATELKAYQQAIRRLGRGLGRRAATHRREAQRHLANCQTAIRAWIMPTYRVAETLAPKPESFDLVIIDEASQSGVDALFLFWLGKQVVVVGDDNQISPANIGIRADDVVALQQQHLGSLELRDLLGHENSLFDQAKVRYSGEVWLTEHFRCMPEIIEFSNRLLYKPQHRPLEPLRQFGNDRLLPLKRCFIPHGEREGTAGRAVNRAEAHALIDRLIACNNDPRYDGLTFGVIGLLGGQADYIEARLLEKLPSDVWRDRRLRCGDAYDFQGDERDVVFLSMVASLEPNRSRIPKLGNRSDEQRFNVAASRARDQMWLFHSMTAEQLNPECVRFMLLNHFLQPPELDVIPFDEPVERGIRHPAFDSLFEQRVFLDIRDRGYVVRPQFEAYGRRIDIVVAGSDSKLAVECDGAEWHGPEEYAADLARQRDLERAGWTFFRVRDTDYYLDRDGALEPLWDLLRNHRIYPRGEGREPAEDSALRTQGRQAPPPEASPAGPIDPRSERETNPAQSPKPSTGESTGLGNTSRDEAADVCEPDQESVARQPLDSAPRGTQPAPPDTDVIEDSEHDATLWSWIDEEERPPPIAVDPGAGQADTDTGPKPYTSWQGRPVLPLVQLSRARLVELLVEIIEVEGPVVAERVYKLANKAAGSSRLGKNIQTCLNHAITSAMRQGQVIRSDPLDDGGLRFTTLRRPHQPVVVVRTRGPRELLRHIPPEELRSVLANAARRTGSTEERYRSALAQYEFKRLTEQTWAFLHRCEQIPDSLPGE